MAWLLVAILTLTLLLVLSSKVRGKTKEKISQSIGIYKFALERSVHKQRNRQKVLDLLQKKIELTNEQIRKSLRASDRSAVRYMDELEKMGKVKQIGTIGRGVIYKLIGS